MPRSSTPGDPPGGAGYPPRRNGALPYGLGFLAYIPIPFFNFIITGIVMASVYQSQRKYGALASENARRAANWGLTMVTVMVVMVISSLVMIPFVDGTEISGVAAIPIGIILPLGIAHLVIIIMGLVKANRGDVFANKLAIPFLRDRSAAGPARQ